MEDRIYLSALLYILILIFIGPFLPSELFNDRTPDADLSDNLNLSATQEESLLDNVSTLKKIGLLLFLPLAIDGLPFLMGALVLIINYLVFIIGVIFIYDKIRGIS